MSYQRNPDQSPPKGGGSPKNDENISSLTKSLGLGVSKIKQT